jgi:hypothetical protein
MMTQTITITATEDTWVKLIRFLALLHHNGGHSGVFGMSFDGDGHERLAVSPTPHELMGEFSHSPSEEEIRRMVDRAGGAGLDVEYAVESGYVVKASHSGRPYYLVNREGTWRVLGDTRSLLKPLFD